jgi:tetratricopeptide (TPR) repeat protein
MKSRGAHRLLHFHPNDAQAYYNRGNCYLHKKDYDRALADFSKAIEINPNLGVAYNNRAFIYEKKGDTARAEADRKKYREIYAIQ